MSLNSVLIEGRTTHLPFMSSDGTCTFHIRNEAGTFLVEANGKLGETCNRELRNGRGVRIVGKLKSSSYRNDDAMSIVAEHVEFKPRTTEAKE